jgi:hypothetical protein
MKTQNYFTENAQLTQEQEKAIALKQHLQESVFVVTHDGESTIFEGDESDEWQNFLNDIEDTEELPIIANFLVYCQNNLTQVEPYDVDDYSSDYLVLTDDESDERWGESLDNYIEECILPELPEYLQNYFDSEKWKEDAKYDGRGHSLSSYDGNEYEEEVNGTTYYIYRIN